MDTPLAPPTATRPPAVGSPFPTWFSDRHDGRSTVLAVMPYTGRYRNLFTWVIRVSAPRTHRGWMEVCL